MNHSLIPANSRVKSILATNPWAWVITSLDMYPKALREEFAPGVRLTSEHVANRCQ